MPTALLKPVGDRCNLGCRYCFYRPGTGDGGGVMEERVLVAAVEAFLASGASPVVFAWQGGEPTLAGIDFYRRAVRIEQALARPGQVVANAFQTNGLLIDGAWAKFLASHRFLVGLSIDGPAEIHDGARRSASGSPSHQRAAEAWGMLRAHGCEVNVLCVVHSGNWSRARDVYHYLTDELEATHLQFVPHIPAAGPDGRSELEPGAYGQFLCELFECWSEERERAVSVKLFDDLVLFLAGKPMRDCMFSPMCDSHLVVEREGSVYPCDFFVDDQHRLGSVLEGPRCTASEAAAAFSARKRRERPRACGDCPHVDVCQGGCPRFWVSDGAGGWRQGLCEDILLFLASCRCRLERMAMAVRQRWQR